MKIPRRLPNLAQVYGQQQKKLEHHKPGNAQIGDRAEISLQAKEIRGLLDKIEKNPEVRTELVQKIKAEIADGSYAVDTKKLAESIISALKDEKNEQPGT